MKLSVNVNVIGAYARVSIASQAVIVKLLHNQIQKREESAEGLNCQSGSNSEVIRIQGNPIKVHIRSLNCQSGSNSEVIRKLQTNIKKGKVSIASQAVTVKLF